MPARAWAGRTRNRRRRSAAMVRRSARPFRSPMTFSTPRATNRRWANAPGRTPNATRRRSSRRSACRKRARSATPWRRRRFRRWKTAVLAPGPPFSRKPRASPSTGNPERMSLTPANPRWPKPLRIIRARPRLFVCALIGVIVGLFLPESWRPVTRGLIGWNVGVWLYLMLAGLMILRSEHQDIHRRALFQDEGRNVILTLAAVASTASFGAIFAQL